MPTIFGHTEVWARSTTCPVCVEITTIFFDFLKSVCYAFGHLYGKREGISPEALMEECLHDVEQAAYHPHKALNQAIAQHLMQGDLQENLDRL